MNIARLLNIGITKLGYCENEVEIRLPKGRLIIQIDRDGSVWMSGPAKRIGKGEYEI